MTLHKAYQLILWALTLLALLMLSVAPSYALPSTNCWVGDDTRQKGTTTGYYDGDQLNPNIWCPTYGFVWMTVGPNNYAKQFYCALDVDCDGYTDAEDLCNTEGDDATLNWNGTTTVYSSTTPNQECQDVDPEHCSDGEKSGDEVGMDCEGSCEASCVQECPSNYYYETTPGITTTGMCVYSGSLELCGPIEWGTPSGYMRFPESTSSACAPVTDLIWTKSSLQPPPKDTDTAYITPYRESIKVNNVVSTSPDGTTVTNTKTTIKVTTHKDLTVTSEILKTDVTTTTLTNNPDGTSTQTIKKEITAPNANESSPDSTVVVTQESSTTTDAPDGSGTVISTSGGTTVTSSDGSDVVLSPDGIGGGTDIASDLGIGIGDLADSAGDIGVDVGQDGGGGTDITAPLPPPDEEETPESGENVGIGTASSGEIDWTPFNNLKQDMAGRFPISILTTASQTFDSWVETPSAPAWFLSFPNPFGNSVGFTIDLAPMQPIANMVRLMLKIFLVVCGFFLIYKRWV